MDPRALHRDALVIDTHNDTLVAHIRLGNLSLSGPDVAEASRNDGVISFVRGPLPREMAAMPIQINLPKMAAGGIDAGFYAIDVTIAYGNRLAYALDGLGYLLNDLQMSASDVTLVRCSQDILDAKAKGVPALILAIEHADVVERSLNVLRSLHQLGVRSLGLTHNVSSLAADGCLEARDGVGLSTFGEALVREMNRLGMVVDLAHVSPGAFYHALEISDRPVLFSHGNARALCDHPRNLTDDQLKALGQQGGMIGLSFVPFFVDSQRPTLTRFLEHADHIVSVAGIDVVGIGSDFDGGGTLLEDATHLPLITEGLANRGYDEVALRKILGQNALRVIKAAIG